jgi:Mor family transcriptional regulator
VKKFVEQWSSIHLVDLYIEELAEVVETFKLWLKRIGKDKELAKLPFYNAVVQIVENFGTSLYASTINLSRRGIRRS